MNADDADRFKGSGFRSQKSEFGSMRGAGSDYSKRTGFEEPKGGGRGFAGDLYVKKRRVRLGGSG